MTVVTYEGKKCKVLLGFCWTKVFLIEYLEKLTYFSSLKFCMFVGFYRQTVKFSAYYNILNILKINLLLPTHVLNQKLEKFKGLL